MTKLKTLIASIGCCCNVTSTCWSKDSTITTGISLNLISSLVNLNCFIRSPSLHEILFIDFFISVRGVLDHLRTVVHLLLNFYHIFSNHAVIAYYLLGLLHLNNLRLSCVI